MRNPRWGYLAAVAAGPTSNLLIALVFSILFRLFPSPILSSFGLSKLLMNIIFLNVVLALFNIIPLSPLDGWSIMYSLLPADQARWWQANQQNSYYVFMLLILLSFIGTQFNVLGRLIFDPSFSLIGTFTGLPLRVIYTVLFG